jgi:sporulation-control protein spo0M
MQRCQTQIHEKLSVDLGETYKEQAKEYMSFQTQLVKSLKYRSESNQKRLKDEIELVFYSNPDSLVMTLH